MKSNSIDSEIDFINTDENHTHSEANLSALEGTSDKLILLIEDNDLVRDMMYEALTFGGYSVVTTGLGSHAIEIMKKYPDRFSLAICDQCLPETSGLEVLNTIHKISPSLKFILMSGYYMDDGYEPPVDKSYAEFLHKPCSVTHLLERVKLKMEV